MRIEHRARQRLQQCRQQSLAVVSLKAMKRDERSNSMSEIRAELRQMIIGVPRIECEDGVADALIRAIQRDSRRPDNFNEAITAAQQHSDTFRESECGAGEDSTDQRL
jgi:hypothetical protein